MKKRIFYVIISNIMILSVSSLFMACALFKGDSAENWKFKRIITINNPSEFDLIDHQINLQFDPVLYSEINEFGNDIRFYNGLNSLPYWIDEWDLTTSYASVWVKVDKVKSGMNEIEIIYGNVGAAPSSDFNATFTKDHYESENANLVGLWYMDEGNDDFIMDSSGNENNGAKTTSAEWVTINDGLWGSKSGTETVFSNTWSLNFNEKEDYVLIPDSLSLKFTAITIETWIKTGADIDSPQYILSKWYEGTFDRSYALSIGNEMINFHTSFSGETLSDDILHCSTLLEDTWYHVAAVLSPSGKSISINGGNTSIKCEDSSSNYDLFTDNSVNLVFGRINENDHDFFSYPYPFKGIIDEVAIYDNALNDDEIVAHSMRRKFVSDLEIISISDEMDN